MGGIGVNKDDCCGNLLALCFLGALSLAGVIWTGARLWRRR